MACTLFLSSTASAQEKVDSYEDQYLEISAGVSRTGKNGVMLKVIMTPRPGWKLLADNSSGTRPLRLKPSGSKCLKVKGAALFSKPDLAGTDDSGVYSEYYLKEAAVMQEFSSLPCSQKNLTMGSAALTYLLCQESKCVGPFSRELKFKVP